MSKRQSLGAACVDAGGVYVFLLNHAVRVQLVGALLSGAKEINAVECLVVPKSKASLCAAIEKEFGPLISCNESEIIFSYYDCRVELTLTTIELWESALAGALEAA